MAKRKVAVKTEPCDRLVGCYGGMIGEKIKNEDIYDTENMDTGINGKKVRISTIIYNNYCKLIV